MIGHPFFNCTGFSKRISLSHPFYHLGWFFYRSGCCHPFFQELYETDHFWQQLLIKTSYFQKTETGFCKWKSTDNNDINIFLWLENPCTFLLAKENSWKRIFNTNSELLQNRKEKQTRPFKRTINWLFNVIWCYSFIACFDWKIGVFQ